MRERWALLIAASTGILVLLLTMDFSLLRNPPLATGDSATPGPAIAATVLANASAREGRRIYLEQACSRCHSIAGAGSPRVPLDGVGERLSAQELHDWIVGADAVKDELSQRTQAAKRDYAALPAAQIDALVAYLQEAKGTP